MTKTPDISVVVPVFNEQDNIPPLLAEIRAALDPLPQAWEVVFVDDGSSDASLDTLRGLAQDNPELVFLSFAENRGQSAAFCAGFDAARAPLIVTMDGDLQNDPADIPALLERLGQGADMVIGFRAKRKDTFTKRISSKVANKVRRWFTKDGVRDTGCSLKLMRRDLLMTLPRFRNMHRFLPALMQAQGAKVAETPVNHRPRHQGVSKYGTWDRLKAGIWDLIGVRWLLGRTFRFEIKESNRDQ